MISDNLFVVGSLSPHLTNNGTVYSDWVSMKKLEEVVCYVTTGGTDATATLSIEEATNASGGSAALIVGSNTLDFAGTEDDKYKTIIVKPSALSDGFTHVRLKVVIGSGGSGAYVAGVLLARGRYSPGNELDSTAESLVVD